MQSVALDYKVVQRILHKSCRNMKERKMQRTDMKRLGNFTPLCQELSLSLGTDAWTSAHTHTHAQESPLSQCSLWIIHSPVSVLMWGSLIAACLRHQSVSIRTRLRERACLLCARYSNCVCVGVSGPPPPGVFLFTDPRCFSGLWAHIFCNCYCKNHSLVACWIFGFA